MYSALILGGLIVALGVRIAWADNLPPVPGGDYVVLLHGMDRTALSMKRLEGFLTQAGYRVINVTYPSRRLTVEQISNDYLKPLFKEKIADHNCHIHFVTHSLGGIVIRQYLSNHILQNLGRVVMLGPPNQGSAIIDRLRSSLFGQNFLSPAGKELGTMRDDLPSKLGPVNFPCGVIAGDCSLNPILSAYLDGPNDGKVTVESAKVAGMADFLCVHYSHTWLMWRRTILCQTLYFLQSGCFWR